MVRDDGFWVFQATKVNKAEQCVTKGDAVLFSPMLSSGSFASGGLTKDEKFFVKYFDKGQPCNPEAEFERLAKLDGLNGCKSGGVPRVYAFGEAISPVPGQTAPAILMEVAKGIPLSKIVEASLLSESAGELPPTDKVVRFGLSLARVYEKLHEKGIVHRDASSNNVLIDVDNISLPVILVDFGNSFENGLSTLTRTRTATPYFGAPEVFQLGDPASRQGFEQDVWAIGALLFYMKTGAYPHGGRIDALGSNPSLGEIVESKREPLDMLGVMWDIGVWQGVTRQDRELAEVIRKCTVFEKEARISLGETIEFLERISLEPRRIAVSEINPRYKRGWEEYDINLLALHAALIKNDQTTKSPDIKKANRYKPIHLIEDSGVYRPLGDDDEYAVQACIVYDIRELDAIVHAEDSPEAKEAIQRKRQVDVESRNQKRFLGSLKRSLARLFGLQDEETLHPDMSGDRWDPSAKARRDRLLEAADPAWPKLMEQRMKKFEDELWEDLQKSVKEKAASGEAEVLTEKEWKEKGNEFLREGIKHFNGTDRPVNLERAFTCFRNSAVFDNVDGMYRAGICLCDGIGTEVDLKEAQKWLKRAAEGGHKGAYEKLRDKGNELLCEGIRHLNGTDRPVNSERAFTCFRDSALFDNVDGMYRAGICLCDGIGTEVDLKEAQKWLKRAAEGGHKGAYEEIVRRL